MISGRLNYTSIISIASRSSGNIILGLQKELKRNVRRGMVVSHVHGDGEYNVDKIKDAIRPAMMEIRERQKNIVGLLKEESVL